jgi:universal stress protein A
MKQFNKILCPYDFSDYADEALAYAIKLSDAHTVISLLNIIQIPYLNDPYGFAYFDYKADELKSTTQKAMEDKVMVLRTKYPNTNIEYLIETDNDPSTKILEIQKNNDFDLVVIGSHGRKGLGRLLMGSIAESILREATCPVLIIKKHK